MSNVVHLIDSFDRFSFTVHNAFDEEHLKMFLFQRLDGIEKDVQGKKMVMNVLPITTHAFLGDFFFDTYNFKRSRRGKKEEGLYYHTVFVVDVSILSEIDKSFANKIFPRSPIDRFQIVIMDPFPQVPIPLLESSLCIYIFKADFEELDW